MHLYHNKKTPEKYVKIIFAKISCPRAGVSDSRVERMPSARKKKQLERFERRMEGREMNELALITSSEHRSKQLTTRSGLLNNIIALFVPILDADMQARFAPLECVSQVTRFGSGLDAVNTIHYQDWIIESVHPNLWDASEWGSLAYLCLHHPSESYKTDLLKIRERAMLEARTKTIFRLWLWLITAGFMLCLLYSGIVNGIERCTGRRFSIRMLLSGFSFGTFFDRNGLP